MHAMIAINRGAVAGLLPIGPNRPARSAGTLRDLFPCSLAPRARAKLRNGALRMFVRMGLGVLIISVVDNVLAI
jgi:hypothetical protein